MAPGDGASAVKLSSSAGTTRERERSGEEVRVQWEDEVIICRLTANLAWFQVKL